MSFSKYLDSFELMMLEQNLRALDLIIAKSWHLQFLVNVVNYCNRKTEKVKNFIVGIGIGYFILPIELNNTTFCPIVLPTTNFFLITVFFYNWGGGDRNNYGVVPC